MLARLFLLFTLVPLLELYFLIRLGTYVGALNTILLVIVTGVAGGLLARSQGLAAIRRIQRDLGEGKVPAESLFDGLLILISGILLITPGMLTDALGLLLLIPRTRNLFKRSIRRRVRERLEQGNVQI